MTTEQRIKRCKLIEKMEKLPELSKKLGLENRSEFQKKRVNDKQACSQCGNRMVIQRIEAYISD